MKKIYFKEFCLIAAVMLISGCGESITPEMGKVDAPPTVDAGEAQIVQSGQEVILNARISDDGISAITWEQVSGPLIRLNVKNQSQTEFIVPSVGSTQSAIFRVTVNDGSNPPASDEVSLTIHPSITGQLVTSWNKLGLALVKKSERGPTVSSRFMAYLNTSLYSSWAAFEEASTGWLVDYSLGSDFAVGNERATLQYFAMAVTAHMLFEDFSSGGLNILRQVHLEIGTGEDAEVFRAELLDSANTLFAEQEAFALNRLPESRRETMLDEVKASATEMANEIIAYAMLDGSQAINDYTDASNRYAPSPWAIPAPTIAQRNKINFYNEVEYTDDDGVLFPVYEFPDFDPVLAAKAVGASWNSEGKLLLESPETLTVNPAVLSGEVQITENWQSLTEWGIFPPLNDGGTQVPLSSHWGEVTPFALATGSSLRPSSIQTPYEDGELNMMFVEELKQVITFAQRMKDRAEGGPLQRAQSEYWELGDATAYPPGWWLEAAVNLISEGNFGLQDSLKATFTVSQAVFDAGIAAWDTKYHFNSVRPYTAANQMFLGSVLPSFRGDVVAGTDDRNVWFPYQLRRNFTPPFPDIPSGHSAFSYAASTVLKELMQSNNFDYASEAFISRFDLTDGFDGSSENGNELTRLSWNYLSLAAEEAGLSRLYGGIHLMEGNWIGLKFGIQIGHATLNKVDALFNGSLEDAQDRSEQWLERIPVISFGTMKEDTLSVLAEDGQSLEVYGFYESDNLVVDGQSSGGAVEFFGGTGADKFTINGSARVAIRDYQRDDQIEIGTGPWGVIEVSDIELMSDVGFSLLRANEVEIVSLDGEWELEDLTISVLP